MAKPQWSMIHPPSAPAVFGIVPAPIVRRLPKWVRSGPTVPFAPVPSMVWQAAHAAERNTCAPRCNVGSVGAADLDDACCSHVRKSAGDASFRHKANAKMQELLSQARTMVMVSHALGSITDMCHEAIWLDHGRMMLHGAPSEVVEAYTDHANVKRDNLTLEDV